MKASCRIACRDRYTETAQAVSTAAINMSARAGREGGMAGTSRRLPLSRPTEGRAGIDQWRFCDPAQALTVDPGSAPRTKSGAWPGQAAALNALHRHSKLDLEASGPGVRTGS